MGLIDSMIGAEGGPAPRDNARAAFDYYVGQGLTPVQAAGIVGNLQGESGRSLNPNAINPKDGRDGSDSIGIGQWNGTRAQALKEYAASKNVPWNDLNTQLEFLHTELKGPESQAYKALLAAQTPQDAGQAMLAYERPKDWNRPGAHPERGQYAAKVFASYGGGTPSPQAPVSRVASAIMGQAAPQPSFANQIMGQQGAMPDVMQAQQQTGSPQIPEIQPMPSIFAAPRKQIDLAKLRAAFKAPTFYGSG